MAEKVGVDRKDDEFTEPVELGRLESHLMQNVEDPENSS